MASEHCALWFNPLFTHFKKFICILDEFLVIKIFWAGTFRAGDKLPHDTISMYLLTYVCLLVGAPKRDLSRLAISSNGFKSLFKNDSLLVLSDVASSTLTLVVLSSQKLWHYLIEIYDYGVNGVTAMTRKLHTLTK